MSRIKMRTVANDPNAPANTVAIVAGRLGGKWLRELGFVRDDVLLVSAVPGMITYQRQENGVAWTMELVKFARQNKFRLLQVQKKGHEPFIEIPRSCLKTAGVMPDEPMFVIYEHNTLKLQRP